MTEVDERKGKGGMLVEAPASYVGLRCVAVLKSILSNESSIAQFVPHPKQPITRALAKFPQRMTPGQWTFRVLDKNHELLVTIFADHIGDLVITEEMVKQATPPPKFGGLRGYTKHPSKQIQAEHVESKQRYQATSWQERTPGTGKTSGYVSVIERLPVGEYWVWPKDHEELKALSTVFEGKTIAVLFSEAETKPRSGILRRRD